MSTAHAVFERMFEVSEDPWGFRTRWYEARKRDLVLASDGAAEAVKLARQRVEFLSHVEIAQAWMPDAQLQWPTLVHHQKKDLVIDVWCADSRSIAEHHGAA